MTVQSRMRLSESEQELLETLWIATDEERREGIECGAALPEGADDLIKHGLAERRADSIVLATAGRPEAEQAVRRHRLAERLLVDLLATEDARIEDQACRLEHVLFEGLDESICTLLGHPQFCPHGKRIPRGACCRELRDSVRPIIAPLGELKRGQAGAIAYIQMNNPAHLQKLMAMGVLPGVPVTLKQRSPSFVFEAGLTQFAVDDDIAADIFVRLDGKN